MDRWQRFGRAVGSHMGLISPACVVLGVLFPGPLSCLRPLAVPLFSFMTFQAALGNGFASLARALGHPRATIVTLALFVVVAPLVALGAGRLLFPGEDDLVCGLVLEYSVPVAVSATAWISMHAGDVPEALTTLMVSNVTAPLTVPLTLSVLMGRSVSMDAGALALDMLLTVAAPTVAGACLTDLAPRRSCDALSRALSPAARVALVLVILSNCTAVAEPVRHLTPTLVGVTLLVGALAAGMFALGWGVARLMGLPRAQVVSMTYQTGMRNISSGAQLAAAWFPPETAFPVVIGTLFQQMLASAFGVALERALGPGEDA